MSSNISISQPGYAISPPIFLFSKPAKRGQHWSEKEIRNLTQAIDHLNEHGFLDNQKLTKACYKKDIYQLLGQSTKYPISRDKEQIRSYIYGCDKRHGGILHTKIEEICNKHLIQTKNKRKHQRKPYSVWSDQSKANLVQAIQKLKTTRNLDGISLPEHVKKKAIYQLLANNKEFSIGHDADQIKYFISYDKDHRLKQSIDSIVSCDQDQPKLMPNVTPTPLSHQNGERCGEITSDTEKSNDNRTVKKRKTTNEENVSPSETGNSNTTINKSAISFLLAT